jgi:N-acetyl-gamma-glutamyl-phosphate reductase
MQKIKIGIMGGAGYTGGELLRILVNHSQAEIVFIHSKSQFGKFVSDIHSDLIGETELVFSNEIIQDIDVVFLCVGHGEAKKVLSDNAFLKSTKVIDLSQDFRIKSQDSSSFVYGLPELNKEAIKGANKIANPGCFATAIQLGLLPLFGKVKIDSDIYISATTGSTGAGQSFSESSHFSKRVNNLSIYKAFTHQHLIEIKQSIHQLQNSFDEQIVMIPQRGAFSRGILASITVSSSQTEEELIELFENYYKEHPFVHFSKKNIDLKQVVNTNKCMIYLEKHENQLMIVSIIDNLLKGASGQAVQNMNLMFGLNETMGLRLKASAF